MKMDFGKILARWEERGGTFKNERKKRGGGEDSPAEMQRRWLENNPVVNKDAQVEAETERERRRRIRRMREQDSIDLHDLSRAQAWRELERFFCSARERRLEKVLIIHGKGTHSKSGEAVLRDMCKSFLEQCEYAGESGHADRQDGGTGVTWVILK